MSDLVVNPEDCFSCVAAHFIIIQVIACPNKKNPYHQCTDYCKNRYGMKKWNPLPDMIRKRDRMLRKYPLPPDWQEVPDPET